MGTPEMWAQVDCETLDLKVYYFSTNPPLDEENYWRYIDGEPVAYGQW